MEVKLDYFLKTSTAINIILNSLFGSCLGSGIFTEDPSSLTALIKMALSNTSVSAHASKVCNKMHTWLLN